MVKHVRRGPLDQLVVVDASTMIAAPLTAMLLGYHGARVIKVEHPEKGDYARGLQGGDSERVVDDRGQRVSWKYFSRGKECVTCDLSKPAGAELFRKLVSKADVLIENFRPGRMEEWSLGYEQLSAENPSLVMLRVSAFGQDGPYAQRPGYGGLAEAMGGLVYVTGNPGEDPIVPGVPVADPLVGATGVAAVMTALWSRSNDEHHRGQEIDLNLCGPMLYLVGPHVTECAYNGAYPQRGFQLGPNVLRGLVACKDGRAMVYSAALDKFKRVIAEFLNEEVHAAAGETAAEVSWRDVPALNTQLRAWLSTVDRNDALAALEGTGFPIAPVYSVPEILTDEHFRARELVGFDDPQLGELMMPGSPFRLLGEETTGPTLWADGLGDQNDRVYREWLGIDEATLGRLRQERVI